MNRLTEWCWLVRWMCLLCVCVSVAFAEEAAKSSVNYRGVYISIDGRANIPSVEKMAKSLTSLCLGSPVKAKGPSIGFEVIDSKKDADPEKLGLFCQIKIENVRRLKKKVRVDQTSSSIYYHTIEYTEVFGRYQVRISKGGKWKKLDKGEISFNEYTPLMPQLCSVIWRSCFDVRVKKDVAGKDTAEVSGQIRNNLPMDAMGVVLSAPVTILCEEVPARPAMAVRKIPAGETEDFSITVPSALKRHVRSIDEDDNNRVVSGDLKTHMVWNKAYVWAVAGLLPSKEKKVEEKNKKADDAKK